MDQRARRFLFLACLLTFLLASAASAQVVRVFVSINGNDANICSNVATPCRTFGGGITQVDDGGEVIVLDTGSYGGTTIAKGVTLNVPPGVTAFAAQPFTINAPNKVVTLRGLTIKALTPGTGTGVNVLAVGTLSVESCVINGWSVGINMTVAGYLRVKDSLIRECSSNGIHVGMPGGSNGAMVEHCRLEGNTFLGMDVFQGGHATIRDSVVTGGTNGLAAQSQTAFGASGVSELSIEGCVVTESGTYGIAAVGENGPAIITVTGSAVTNSNTGLFASNNTGTAIIRASTTTVIRNVTGLLVSGGSSSLLSRADNTVEANTTNGAFTSTFLPK